VIIPSFPTLASKVAQTLNYLMKLGENCLLVVVAFIIVADIASFVIKDNA
jgi:hypothetical protein